MSPDETIRQGLRLLASQDDAAERLAEAFAPDVLARALLGAGGSPQDVARRASLAARFLTREEISRASLTLARGALCGAVGPGGRLCIRGHGHDAGHTDGAMWWA